MYRLNVNVKINHCNAKTRVSVDCIDESKDKEKTAHKANPSKRIKVIVYDEQKAVDWLNAHQFYECFRDRKPRIVKPAVRRLLEQGIDLLGIEAPEKM